MGKEKFINSQDDYHTHFAYNEQSTLYNLYNALMWKIDLSTSDQFLHYNTEQILHSLTCLSPIALGMAKPL